MKIGVIGLGVVGSTLYQVLKETHDTHEILGYDIDENKCINGWSQIVTCNWVFVCVPTDSGTDGRLDMSNIEKVLDGLQSFGFYGTCVIKSTMQLGWISKKYYPYRIIVFPEWLYEAKPYVTTINPEMTVVGFHRTPNYWTNELLTKVCPWHGTNNAFYCVPEEAVMIKLTANALAATKISFANQIQLICKEYSINAQLVLNKIKTDPRCSPRYLDPGRPFGGYCLPKDTKELASCSGKASLFNAVIAINEWIKDGITKRAN